MPRSAAALPGRNRRPRTETRAAARAAAALVWVRRATRRPVFRIDADAAPRSDRLRAAPRDMGDRRRVAAAATVQRRARRRRSPTRARTRRPRRMDGHRVLPMARRATWHLAPWHLAP